jgi:hypothetical protein
MRRGLGDDRWCAFQVVAAFQLKFQPVLDISVSLSRGIWFFEFEAAAIPCEMLYAKTGCMRNEKPRSTISVVDHSKCLEKQYTKSCRKEKNVGLMFRSLSKNFQSKALSISLSFTVRWIVGIDLLFGSFRSSMTPAGIWTMIDTEDEEEEVVHRSIIVGMSNVSISWVWFATWLRLHIPCCE